MDFNKNNIDNLKYRFDNLEYRFDNLEYRFDNFNKTINLDKLNIINNNSNIIIKKISNDKKFNKILFYNKLTNKLIKNNICPNFIMMYGYDSKKLNIFMEKVEGTLLDFLKNISDDKVILSALFQIIYSIMIIQSKIKTFHTKLDMNNIFYKKINNSIKYFKYKINYDEYIIPTYGYLFMISNFDNAQTLLNNNFNDLNKKDIEFGIKYNYDFDNLKLFGNKIFSLNIKKTISNYDSLMNHLKNKDKLIIQKVYSKYENNNKNKYSEKKLFNMIIDYCVNNNFLNTNNIKIDSEYKLPSDKTLKLINLIFESKNNIIEILKDYFNDFNNPINIKFNEIINFNYDKKNKISELSRNKEIINKDHNLTGEIKNLYQINKFNYSTSKYFHIFPNRNFTPKFINPMYSDIEPYDYIKPITKLNLRFKNNYYSKLINSYNYDKKTKLNLYSSNELTQIDLDEIMLQYVKCRKKCFIITLWPIFAEYLDIMVKYLELKGNIYYTKYIEFESNGLINYLISVYDEFSNNDILKIAKNKYSWSKLPNQKSNKIAIIIFDNINNLALSGQASIFKTELRNLSLNVLKKNNIGLENIRGNDLIHINDYFYQTIEYCELLLNSNSINLLNNRLYSKIYDKYFETTYLKIETYRKIIYSNLSLETINSLFLIAGVSLFFYGFRPINDLDGICINPDIDYKNKNDNASEDIKKITKLFCDEKTRIFYIEFGATNTEYWKEKWTQFNAIIAKYFEISDFNDICWNPNYHYYFKGIKCYLIDFEFYKKLQRSNEIIGTDIWPTLSKDYTDYIMINYLNPKLIEKFIYIDKTNGKLTVSKKIIDIYPKLNNPLPFNNSVLNLINKFLISKYKVYLDDNINNNYIKSLF